MLRFCICTTTASSSSLSSCSCNTSPPPDAPSTQAAPDNQKTPSEQTAPAKQAKPEAAPKNATMNFATGPCGILGKYLWETEAERKLPSGLVPHELVLNCHAMHVFNKTRASKTIKVMSALESYYAFENITDRNVRREREKIAAKLSPENYVDDNTFTEAILRKGLSYYDANMQYISNCYRQFTFILPIYLLAVVDKDLSTRIILYAVDKFAPPELRDYVGGEIISINSIPALRNIEAYSNKEYGCCRNRRTRFTRMFSSMMLEHSTGKYKLDRGQWTKRISAPIAGPIKFKIRKPKSTVEKEFPISWLALPKKTLVFKNFVNYWNDYCEAKPSDSGKNNQTGTGNSTEEPADLSVDSWINATGSEENITEPSTIEKASLQIPNPIVTGPGFAFFIMDGGDVVGKFGILSIATFDCLSSHVKAWHTQILSGFKALEEKGAKRILIDVSNNGGGRICLAYSLVALFSPSRTTHFPYPDKPFKTVISADQNILDVVAAATKAELNDTSMRTPFSLTWFLDPNTFKPLGNPDEFLSKKEERKRTVFEKVLDTAGKVKQYVEVNRTQNFTQPLLDNCLTKTPSPLAGYTAYTKDVIVMTNGYSGSSAAIVTASLQKAGITTVVFSTAVIQNNTDIKQTPFSFTGAQMATGLQLSNSLKKLGLYKNYSPGEFPTQIDAIFPYRAIVTDEANGEVLEFQPAEANVEVRLTPELALNVGRMWLVAMEEGGVYKKWWPSEKVGQWRANVKAAVEITGKGGGQLLALGNVTSTLSEDFQTTL